MSEYVNINQRVKATFYDDKHEERSVETKTIADILDSVCDDYKIITDIFPAIGTWDKVSDKYPKYACSCCRHLYNNKEYKYCPSCGALMKRRTE